MTHKLTRTHVLLFIATFFTTLMAGALLNGVIPWEEPGRIYLGLPFSLTLLLILGTHELSHYYMSRRHHVQATLPYFIPAPPIPFIIGTFGAIIKMKPPIPDRRSLIDIGASGPIGGFVIAVIACFVGLNWSEVVPSVPTGDLEQRLAMGHSILFGFISKLVINIDSDKYDIILHPIAFAGWVGLLVTSLNLLPIGQLDGGHIVYALFGERHATIARITIPVLLVMGLTFWPGWILWAALMIIIGYKHPPVVYPHIMLDKRRKNIGWLSLVIFIITFTPEPFKLI
ncbi:MAG: site-2 protease family protein [Nitrospiraceae bacterium]|nr:MAG: site-2 protease family protein [Nitrospiraceae bacterium]UCH45109.1 MAG: site-2 protease family protein [Nitrospiraceae bacterium]